MPAAMRSNASRITREKIIPTRFRNDEPLAFTIEELDRELGLKRLDLMAHGALRDAHSSSAARVKLSCRAAASKCFKGIQRWQPWAHGRPRTSTS